METETSKKQNALRVFRQVCADFDEVANSPNLERRPWHDGVSSRFKYFLRHPIKASAETFKQRKKGRENRIVRQSIAFT